MSGRYKSFLENWHLSSFWSLLIGMREHVVDRGEVFQKGTQTIDYTAYIPEVRLKVVSEDIRRARGDRQDHLLIITISIINTDKGQRGKRAFIGGQN